MKEERHPTRRDFLVRSMQAAGGILLGGSALAPPLWGSEARAVGPAKAKSVVSFSGWGEKEEEQGVLSAIDLFEKEHPGIPINWLHIPAYNEYQYPRTIMAMLAAGAPPDVGFVPGYDYTTWARDGLLLDITDRIKSDPALGGKGYFIEPQEAHRSVIDGRWYGIGSCWVGIHMYYDGGIFKEAGIAPPSNDPEKAWTWEHFVRVAVELTVDSQGKHPGDSGFDVNRVERWGVIWQRWWEGINAAIVTHGGEWIDQETGLMVLDRPAAVQAIQDIADLMLKYQVMPAASSPEFGPSNTALLNNHKVAMVVDGSWALSWIHKAKVDLGTAVLPMTVRTGTALTAHLHGIFSGCKQPDAAWEWMKFLASEQYQLEFLKIGLWLPSQTALMTPEGLRKWMTLRKGPTEGVHPAGYDLLVTEYVPKYGKAALPPPGWREALALMDPVLDSIWSGKKTAAEAMAEAVPKANAILKAKQRTGGS